MAALLGIVNRLPIGERAVPCHGHRLYADTLDRLVAAIGWSTGLMARRERLLLERLLRPGMVAVDVGANIGFHTLVMARAVGATGRVYAIEPEPRNFRLLERAVREARYGHVRLSRAAAGDRRGQVPLHLAAANRGDHRTVAAAERRERIMVDAVVLDDLLSAEPRVDLLKIDVQGSEPAVLRGLARTLGRSTGVRVLCELSPDLIRRGGADAEAFFTPLRAQGLAPHAIGAGGRTAPLAERAAWAVAEVAGYEMFLFAKGSSA
jgi:FkbM family methyltransferase